MDRKDTILILNAYKHRNRVAADDFDKIGEHETAQRYRDMAEWFAGAIKWEEYLLEEEEKEKDGEVRQP